MENEEKQKKEWQVPEIVDLDLDKTMGGVNPSSKESTVPGGGVS